MRIPDYYCPHCRMFKSKREVMEVTQHYMTFDRNYIECKHCGCTKVMNTKDEFEKFLDEMELNCNEECERKGK